VKDTKPPREGAWRQNLTFYILLYQMRRNGQFHVQLASIWAKILTVNFGYPELAVKVVFL
jgi:hypothetical protein